MIWHRLACTTLCIHVLDSDKSILRGRCIRVWSILISILRFQLLGLVSYSTAFFTFSFLVFLLSLILYNSGSYTIPDLGPPSMAWDGTTNHPWQVFKRPAVYDIHSIAVWHTHISFSVYFLDSFIFRPSAILSKLQLQPGVNGTLSENRKKPRKKGLSPSLLSLILNFDFQ